MLIHESSLVQSMDITIQSDDGSQNVYLKYCSALSGKGNYIKLCGRHIFSVKDLCCI
jgi:hypothetical protein